MAMNAVLLTKADGSQERFSEAKVCRCLRVALRSCQYDVALAASLARAVALHVVEWKDDGPADTEYVYRCVRTVLRQTGLVDVAEALAEHRRQRRLARGRLRVVDVTRPSRSALPWRKASMVGWLQNRCGVRHALARMLAAEVESNVIKLGFRTVRNSLISELLRNELMSWGLTAEAVAAEPQTVATTADESPWPTREE